MVDTITRNIQCKLHVASCVQKCRAVCNWASEERFQPKNLSIPQHKLQYKYEQKQIHPIYWGIKWIRILKILRQEIKYLWIIVMTLLLKAKASVLYSLRLIIWVSNLQLRYLMLQTKASIHWMWIYFYICFSFFYVHKK